MAIELERIIEILADELDTELNLDAGNLCNIMINDQIAVQLELDKTGENVMLGCMILEISPGKFRENVLKAALKANYVKEKGIGNFSYIPKSATLCLFEFLPLDYLTEESTFKFFTDFCNKALNWHENLQAGRIPTISSGGSPSSNPFGIR
jgi:hypothetical protein